MRLRPGLRARDRTKPAHREGEIAMPLSRAVARFNRRATNRVLGRVAGWMPGFGIVTHIGRRSAKTYQTPINLFRDGDVYRIALTYGAESDWVRNVLAAGGCTVET